mmetsp:Transcript_51636/g.130571  ORF Transcript_51636/g.130571 Transcript_51636/m.130571 type:complete len:103 (-) Transcript_51636:45-353(-)
MWPSTCKSRSSLVRGTGGLNSMVSKTTTPAFSGHVSNELWARTSMTKSTTADQYHELRCVPLAILGRGGAGNAPKGIAEQGWSHKGYALCNLKCSGGHDAEF